MIICITVEPAIPLYNPGHTLHSCIKIINAQFNIERAYVLQGRLQIHHMRCITSFTEKEFNGNNRFLFGAAAGI